MNLTLAMAAHDCVEQPAGLIPTIVSAVAIKQSSRVETGSHLFKKILRNNGCFVGHLTGEPVGLFA
jgi:hypothetical protein